MVYILCASQPIGSDKHSARHYIGYCRDGRLEDRITEHRTGCGARFTQVLNERGIEYEVVNTLKGNRKLEQQLKKRHNHKRLCPICSPHLFDKKCKSNKIQPSST